MERTPLATLLVQVGEDKVALAEAFSVVRDKTVTLMFARGDERWRICPAPLSASSPISRRLDGHATRCATTPAAGVCRALHSHVAYYSELPQSCHDITLNTNTLTQESISAQWS